MILSSKLYVAIISAMFAHAVDNVHENLTIAVAENSIGKEMSQQK